MPPRVIYFISDLHLTDGTKAERFKYPQELLGLLDRVEAEAGAELVIVGDWFEGWAADLAPIFAAHADIIARIFGLAGLRPVTYVVGNHDALPWYWFVGESLGPVRVVERYVTRIGGQTLVAIHGHQFDPFNQVRAKDGQWQLPGSRHVVHLLGLLERAGLGGLVERIRDSADDLEPLANEVAGLNSVIPPGLLQATHDVMLRQSPGQRGYPRGEDQYRAGARKLMGEGARYVVMGHTHHPERITMGPGIYLNSGSWVWERYGPTYGRLDSSGLHLLNGATHAPATLLD